ncbi:MAG: T9SS type A sorting domain-containing protein [Saprospiraceae bacterium]
MKTFFLLTFFTLLTICSQAQDTIKYTSFEGDTVWKGKGLGTGLIGGVSTALIGDTTDGANDTPAKQRILTGKRSWQISNTSDTLVMDSVIVSNYDSIRFRLRFSGTSTSNGQGLDKNDSIKIYVAVNGNSFSELPQIRISGSSSPINSEADNKWGFNADSLIKTSYDTSTVYGVPGSGLDTLTLSSTAIITFFKPGITSIKVKIVAFTDNSQEIWNIDDLILSGKRLKGLAIKGMAFNVREQNAGVMLHWSKSDESECAHYTVQRSVDFKSFDNIKSMDCLNRENNLHSYSYHDLGSSPGWNYYRIKLNFVDGSFDYSEIKSVYRNNTSAFKVFPTLVNDVLQVSAPTGSEYKYVIVDVNGKTMQVKKNTIDTKSIQVDQLPSGVYFILLTSGSTSETFKFIRL